MNKLTKTLSLPLPVEASHKLFSWLSQAAAFTKDKLNYVQHFSVTGSVCPSTRYFGERAAAEVTALAGSYDRVVVASIGSGVVANRVYARFPDAVFVECEAVFADQFKQLHPRAMVICDRIEQLHEHLPDLRGQRVLLASFVPTAGQFHSSKMACLFVEICESGGLVMQMRYLPHRMSTRFFEGIQACGVDSARLFTVVKNLPPVSMYSLSAKRLRPPRAGQIEVLSSTTCLRAEPYMLWLKPIDSDFEGVSQ